MATTVGTGWLRQHIQFSHAEGWGVLGQDVGDPLSGQGLLPGPWIPCPWGLVHRWLSGPHMVEG